MSMSSDCNPALTSFSTAMTHLCQKPRYDEAGEALKTYGSSFGVSHYTRDTSRGGALGAVHTARDTARTARA